MGAIKKLTGLLKDIDAFPVLTEDFGASQRASISSPSTPSVGQVANRAVAEVLGWKIKDGDPKGFIGALTQSFTLTEVEGHIESTWKPRSYAVQTDLSGGITGAQASVYSRAKDALDQALPLLEGLYTLDTEADPEDVTALKAVVRSQITELVAELGMLGGPRVSRVNQYFGLLIGDAFPNPATNNDRQVDPTDPDGVGGTLGNLRNVLGLTFQGQDFVNTVDEERNLSNYRILSDDVTSLAQSWLNNLDFFGLDSATPFFGTQLVLLSRQLSVVSEQVDEVRFTLDSVFITASERQTLRLDFKQAEPPMFAEELFSWIQSFATEEGPRLIEEGGKFGVQNTFLPLAKRLAGLVLLAQDTSAPGLPAGYRTARVQRALNQLQLELDELVKLADPIRHVVKTEDGNAGLDLVRVEPPVFSGWDLADLVQKEEPLTLKILGSGFESPPQPRMVTIGSVFARQVYFVSDGHLVALFDANRLPVERSDVTVRNPSGPSVTLPGGFMVTMC